MKIFIVTILITLFFINFVGFAPNLVVVSNSCTAGQTLVYEGNYASGEAKFKCETPGSASIPTDSILLIKSGTCPTGFVEDTSLENKTLLGTLVANADVGTTGGSDNITPTGSVSSISDILNHTHAVNITDPGHTHLTQRYPTATGSSSGFTIDTSMSGTLADNTLPTKTNTTGITASSNNPAGGVASITPTFTGNSFDNRSAFIKVIFCRKT